MQPSYLLKLTNRLSCSVVKKTKLRRWMSYRLSEAAYHESIEKRPGLMFRGTQVDEACGGQVQAPVG